MHPAGDWPGLGVHRSPLTAAGHAGLGPAARKWRMLENPAAGHAHRTGRCAWFHSRLGCSRPGVVEELAPVAGSLRESAWKRPKKQPCIGRESNPGNPMDCSMPGLPVHHQLLEFTQTHVHRVGDALSPPDRDRRGDSPAWSGRGAPGFVSGTASGACMAFGGGSASTHAPSHDEGGKIKRVKRPIPAALLS